MKKYLIWGTGEYTQSVLNLLNEKKINTESIIGFIDNSIEKSNDNKYFHERSVYSPFQILNLDYDYIVILSGFFDDIYKQAVNVLHIEREKILDNYNFLLSILNNSLLAVKLDSKIKHQIFCKNKNVEIEDYTYGFPEIFDPLFVDSVKIGKFCSIAERVRIMVGSEHNTKFISTYPFSAFMPEYDYFTSHLPEKGDVIIGNDVWIASDVKIMSGVVIGDGSIIAANAVVTKNVEPYSIVGGVPAKLIKKRFNEATIENLIKIKWWDWEEKYIDEVIPLLQSEKIDELIEFYDKIVCK